MQPTGPFSGLTVIDLTRVLAGPFATMVLADLGARVIKVEMPERGDDARAYGPFIHEKSAYFMPLNRGKESIALNLKKDNDRAIFLKLLATADVLVENFCPGTMEKLGFGWEALHTQFPRLIYAACSGFGHTGPEQHKPAYDMVVQAMGGIMSITGHPGQEPVRVGTSVGDITAGLFTANGIAAALYHRTQSGEGMKVDVSLLDCQIAILENAVSRYYATGKAPEPLGSRHPSITPFECYKTQDGYIVIAAGNDGLFEQLCHTLGNAALAKDPRFLSNRLRNDHAEALKQEIEVLLQHQPTTDWLKQLEQAKIPCGPINNVKQALEEPQIQARNMVIEAHDPIAGTVKMPGNPIKLSAFADPVTRKSAPDLDADREHILAELNKQAIPVS